MVLWEEAGWSHAKGTSGGLWSLLGVESWLESLGPALGWAGPHALTPFPSPVPCASSLDDL